jgi:putative transposase
VRRGIGTATAIGRSSGLRPGQRVGAARPRAGCEGCAGRWRSRALSAYKRLTRQAESLIAGAYLAGTNTRRVRRALATLFGGAVGKDTVSRVWQKLRADWQARRQRSLADEDIIRLILDGTVVRVRLDRQSTSPIAAGGAGVRRDGQKVLLAIRNMGGEGEAAWRARRDDMICDSSDLI